MCTLDDDTEYIAIFPSTISNVGLALKTSFVLADTSKYAEYVASSVTVNVKLELLDTSCPPLYHPIKTFVPVGLAEIVHDVLYSYTPPPDTVPLSIGDAFTVIVLDSPCQTAVRVTVAPSAVFRSWKYGPTFFVPSQAESCPDDCPALDDAVVRFAAVHPPKT